MTLRIFCAGAVRGAMARLTAALEKETGEKLDFTFGAVGTLKKKVDAGEPADFLVLSRPALETLAREGRVQSGSIRELGRVGVGIAVREGARAPSIATPAELSQALLAAASLSYGDPAHGDSSGVHFDEVLERLGIKARLAPRLHLAPSGIAVAELVREGKAELGATQASVIAASPGIALAGLLPRELQRLTTYAYAIASGAASADAARRMAAFLATPAARSVLDAARITRE
jgi:molybdate transport system substrate-binding protein